MYPARACYEEIRSPPSDYRNGSLHRSSPSTCRADFPKNFKDDTAVDIPQSEGLSLGTFYAKVGRLQIKLEARCGADTPVRRLLRWPLFRCHTFVGQQADKSVSPTQVKSGSQRTPRRTPVLSRAGFIFMMVFMQSRQSGEVG